MTTNKCAYCDLGSGCNHEWGCPEHPASQPSRGPIHHGAWECPRCHVINAPWKSQCDCPPETEIASTTYINVTWPFILTWPADIKITGDELSTMQTWADCDTREREKE